MIAGCVVVVVSQENIELTQHQYLININKKKKQCDLTYPLRFLQDG